MPRRRALSSPPQSTTHAPASFPLLAALRARRAPAGAAPAVLAFLAAALAAPFAAPFADLGAEAKAAEASQASLPGRIAALAPPSPAALARPPLPPSPVAPPLERCRRRLHEHAPRDPPSSQPCPVALDARGCRVASGLWRAFYSGRLVSDPSELEVDHLVALKEAHESGGAAWSPARRLAFAEAEDNLVLALGAVNRAKGAGDPGRWPRAGEAGVTRRGRCAYWARHGAVKRRWGLTLDAREARALEAGLAACRQAPGSEAVHAAAP